MNKFIKIVCISILTAAPAHGMHHDPANLGEQLIDATQENDHIKVSKLIKQGAPLNYADNDGFTALMCAASDSDRDCVLELIHANATVDQADIHGWTALMFAVKSHNHDVLQALIASGARANLANKCGTTALKYAVLSNDFLSIPKDLLLSTCELLVEAMLRIPNQKQKTQMVKFLSCLKHRRQGLREIDRNRKEFFETAFTQEVYFQNRDNFAKSVAYQEIAKLPEGPIKKALLEKYNRNPNTNSANESGKK